MLRFLNWCRLALCFSLLVTLAILTKELVERSQAHQVRKYDHADINHMKYNLFSVGSWKSKIADIVVKEIKAFKIDDSNKVLIKKHLEGQLDVLIDKVNEQIKASNQDSTRGWIKQNLMDMLVDVEDIKKGIPTYADAIVDRMTENDTQAQLRDLVKTRVAKYLAKTFEKEDTSETDVIVQRVGAKNIDEAREWLAAEVPVENERLFKKSAVVMGVAILIFLLGGYHHKKQIPAPFFFICWATLLILLFAGVTTPMIDMDARISKFGFVLLGYNIEFLNQTVYFQSKSILDVFWIMITHAKVEMRVVGVLLILFSIVFPVSKLTMSIFYYYDVFGARKSRFVDFIVLKSGKWSMADVMVVAILMAYIGFNGMVTTQMGIMAQTMPETTFISTNGTTMQIGFFIFVTYVVLAIFFSVATSRARPSKTEMAPALKH